MFGWDRADLALVSNGLPPGPSGYQHILEQLLGAIPEDRLVTVGIRENGGSWGRRPRLPFPARRSAPGQMESLLTAGAVASAEILAPPLFRQLAPEVRRIFATMDPTLGFATSWARGVGAELWVYAIDLHMVAYWRAGGFLRSRMLAWREEAFRYATRIFALTGTMADWLRGIG